MSDLAPTGPRGERRARTKSLFADVWNLPNLLTFGRIVMIPVCLYFLDKGDRVSCYWAALIFTLAAFTDLLDGWLARRMNIESVLGKLLDPLADKLIVMATLVWMVPMGRIPAWTTVLLLGREFSITGLRSIAASEGLVISAGQDSKTKTALQMIGIIALLLGHPYPLSYLGVDLGLVDVSAVGRALIYVSLVFSLASAAQYVGLLSDATLAHAERDRELDADPEPEP